MEHRIAMADMHIRPDVKKETRNRFAAGIRGIQQNSRAQAEHAYKTREFDQMAYRGDNEKKRMRNKSAFISRHRKRLYGKLLAQHLQQLELERNEALQLCSRYTEDIQKLCAQVARISGQVAETMAPTSLDIGASLTTKCSFGTQESNMEELSHALQTEDLNLHISSLFPWQNDQPLASLSGNYQSDVQCPHGFTKSSQSFLQ